MRWPLVWAQTCCDTRANLKTDQFICDQEALPLQLRDQLALALDEVPQLGLHEPLGLGFVAVGGGRRGAVGLQQLKWQSKVKGKNASSKNTQFWRLWYFTVRSFHMKGKHTSNFYSNATVSLRLLYTNLRTKLAKGLGFESWHRSLFRAKAILTFSWIGFHQPNLNLGLNPVRGDPFSETEKRLVNWVSHLFFRLLVSLLQMADLKSEQVDFSLEAGLGFRQRQNLFASMDLEKIVAFPSYTKT